MTLIDPSSLISQRRLAAELLAYTLTKIFPAAFCLKVGIDSTGFYCDFVFEQPLNEEVLQYIDSQWRTYIKEDKEFCFITMMRENAKNFFHHHQLNQLANQVSLLSGNVVEIFHLDNFYSICPELPFSSTKEAGYVKLLSFETFLHVENEEEVLVTRLKGTSFDSPSLLKQFCKVYDHYLKRRDHRLLGPLLDLFHFTQLSQQGEELETVVWHSKGICLSNLLISWIKNQIKEPYEQVCTPSFKKTTSFSSSAFSLDFKKSSYCFKTSPLAYHLQLLKSHAFDFQDLPLKINEFSSFIRLKNEIEQGLWSQGIYQGDWTTLYCSQKQVVKEITSFLQFIEQIITILGFNAYWTLLIFFEKGKREKRQKHIETEWLKEAFKAFKQDLFLSSEYLEEVDRGPRLELRLVDQLGRTWPVSFIEIAKSYFARGKEQTGVVIVKSIWGCLDRWIALLIEQKEGVLPRWLAPEQVRLLVIGKTSLSYAKEISKILIEKGIRVKIDQRPIKLEVKVHAAEKEKIPYLVIVGEKEQHKRGVSIRTTSKPNWIQWFELESFLDKICQECLIPTLNFERSLTESNEEKQESTYQLES